jgi:hypothetical protein
LIPGHPCSTDLQEVKAGKKAKNVEKHFDQPFHFLGVFDRQICFKANI